MNTAPQSRIEIPNYTNYQPQQELTKLRHRVADLMRLGGGTPETFVQTVMQLWQECERRRQGCVTEAEDHLTKYHALNAQAHGFSAISSILFSIINGFATLEERRLQEMADRARERAENGPPEVQEAPPAPPPPVQAAPVAPAPEAPRVPVVKAPPVKSKPSGGKRKKP